MKKFGFLILMLYCFMGIAQVQSPSDFLPLYGKQVSYYHQVEAYFNHLDTQSDWMQKQSYGKTNQDRDLQVFFISTPENLRNLETIRQKHLHAIDLYPKSNTTVDKAIVWLSFNVHGNEIGAIESALSVAHALIAPENKETKKWLEDVIVILDPCLNPDGFSRYAHWLRDISGVSTHPGVYDREHMEPWPGGRQNHYVYDLNRDWAWQTQLETQQRMDLYHQWMPMVHVDVHEMGYNEPYFFPPAAEPFHEQIAPYQRDFHQKIGALTALKFDAQNWAYYTNERFDLFYPSYGDTYPSFNGAVGMTYEQGGIGAGRAVMMNNGQILTIQDRIDHHTVAVLAAVELSFVEKESLIKSFRNHFREARSKPKSTYQTYVVKNGPKNTALLALLNRNRIEAFFADETKTLKGFSYQTHNEESFTIAPNDIIIKVDQPRSVLTQVLFEPFHKLTDSLSYDITSWALPWAYGVESYALKSNVSLKTKTRIDVQVPENHKNVYAYYVPWNNRSSAHIVGQLHKNNIKIRSVHKAATVDGVLLQRGGIIIAKSDNPSLAQFDERVKSMIQSKSDYALLSTGFGEKGGDLGGENYPLMKAPKIMVLGGYGVSNIDFGQVWFYMDQVINYPVSIVELQYFNRVDLKDYNTLILPNGWYNFTENQQKVLDEFVSKGGKIIALGHALNLFEDREGYHLTTYATKDAEQQAAKASDEEALKNRLMNYDGEERRAISSQIPGAIIENNVDESHPLGFGLGTKYFSLKTTTRNYQLLTQANNVIYVPKKYKSSGFIGYDMKKPIEESVTFAVDSYGRGKVVYMIDNPLFRGFWENGNLLFSNALFQVN